MIHVLVTLVGGSAPFVEAHADRSRREPGCVRFELLEAPNGRAVLYEQYLDEAAFEAHRNTPHYRYWRKVTDGLPRKHEEIESVCSGTDAIRVAAVLKACGRRIVWTNGVFDLLGPHHVSMLQGARAQGDLLIAGVNSDDSAASLKRRRPVRTAAERAAMVAAVRGVDLVVEFADEGSLVDLIAAVAPDVLAKGEDRRGEKIPGQEHAGRLHFCRRRPGSTTELLRRLAGTRE